MHGRSVRAVSLAFSFFTFFAAVSEAGPVSGRIVDPDGRAVAGANVLLVKGTTIISSVVTDDSGRFSIAAPDDEVLEVRVAVDGFRARVIPLTSANRTNDVGDVRLAVSAVSESIVVSAAQAEVPLSTTSSSVTVITGEELLARQVEGVADALRLVPGLTVASAGGRGAQTSLFPRGGESDYSLVFIDGVQANAFGGGFDFAHVPVVNIDRIEIVRGPQSALYGSNAIGSVIRVITKRGGPPSAAASFEGGSFGTGRVAAGSSGSAGPWQWGVATERLKSDGMNDELSPAGDVIANDDYERHTVSAGAAVARSDGAGIRADVRYLTDERGAPGPFGSNPAGFFEGIDTVSRGDNERWLSSLSGQVPVHRRLRLQAQVAHGRTDGSFVSRFSESESFSRRTTARVQADLALPRGLETSAGTELQWERAGSTFITAGESQRVPVERSLTGLFGEARWNHAARVYVTTGLRVERITREAIPGNPTGFSPRPDFPNDTVISANPKLSAAWYLRSDDGNFTKLRASAGTGIRPPDGFEIAFTDNPSLKPERSRSFDAGVDHAFLDGQALVEATTFYNRYDDLIVAVGSFSQASRFRTDNISNARARGLELAGNLRTRLHTAQRVDLQFRAAYTLLDTEILAVDRSSGAPPPFTPGDALLRRPKHQFSAEVFVRSGRVTSYVQGGGRTRVRDVEPSLGTFGGLFDSAGYVVWNVGASWKARRQIEIFGRVNNILDRSYEEVFGYPALGRGALLGLRVAAGR